MTYFILSADRNGTLSGGSRLLSYSGVAKAGKMVLTLKVEVSGFGISDALESLEALQRAHTNKPAQAAAPKAAPQTGKKRIGQTKVLALPAPDREA